MFKACGNGNTSGDEDDDDDKDGDRRNKNTNMQIDEDSSCHDNQPSVLDHKANDLECVGQLDNHNEDEKLNDKIENSQDIDLETDTKNVKNEKVKVGSELNTNCEDKMSVGDLDTENSKSNDCNNKETTDFKECVHKLNGDSEGKENCENIKIGHDMSDSDVEMEVKRELREAVEIRIPKVRSKREINEYKWMSSSNGDHSNSRPETPPLQKLMRQDFSPLKSDHKSPSPARKMKESSSSHHKEGFTSKLASVIVPSTSVSSRTASHPKQLLSHSLASLRSSSLKPVNFSKHSHLSSSFPSKHYPPSKQMFNPADNDQPLDLSKKSSKDGKLVNSLNQSRKSNFSKLENGRYFSKQENGMSSTSLQSLQQKFGGDYHLRGLRKPTNYMLFGPEIPALHQALLHSASMSIPHQPLPMSNGASKLKPEQGQSYRYRNSTPPSPSHKHKSEENAKSVKREITESEKSVKREKSDKTETEISTAANDDNVQSEKYTNHMCTCGKWFDSLYSLSLHLQETGHLPARSKSVSLLEYPKLVRGQDMWLNQESEQTRRILRCIQCGESFRTLPMLTVHMMKTQHYTKIVSSEHARRAHKCSAYCDKEQDKECVFKCKVCQDTFSDMEGLANHMIMSGHHKKQNARPPPTFGDLQYRQKRKRLYNFEDNLNPYGNPALAAMLDYKRKYLPEQVSPDPSMENEDSDDTDGSTISCENCGNRIETKLFVEHVRVCLGKTLAEDIRRDIEKVSKEVREKNERIKNDDKLTKDTDDMKSPAKKRKHEQFSPSSNSINCENRSCENEQEDRCRNPIIDSDDEVNTNSKSSKKEEDKNTDNLNDSMKFKQTNKALLNMSGNMSFETKNIEDNEREKENVSTVDEESKEIQALAKSTNSSPDDHCVNGLVKPEDEKRKTKRENGENEDRLSTETQSKKASYLSKKLDIIDPDNMTEDGAGGSALSAMESFIQKSFSNKFDYKKGNIIISPHTSADATIHSRPLASVMNMDSMDYLSKYTKFYNALNLPNGFGSESIESERKKSRTYTSRNNEDETEKEELKMKKETDRKTYSSSPYSHNGDKDDGRSSVKSCLSDGSVSLDTNENLEKKYLNMSENDDQETKAKKDKSSALDNLSSFVYGQPMTSEHPLDSLQRLITKADIPKLMSTHGARAFKYLPPHLQLHHQSNQELTVPLNLTVKSQNVDSDEEEERLRPEDDSLSDYEAASSPANSDGDPMEYRCTACSRKFASKGSYRYHLSRCHLSSVKRYGIKEAFNMSPYVYLPLDHTAKFSKYYEMARELANKRK